MNQTLQVDLQTLIWSIVGSSLIALRAYRRKSLTPMGCAAGWIVGFVAGIHGLYEFLLVLAFFISSTFVTKLGAKRKKKVEADYVASGNRSAWQVLCNGGGATLLLLGLSLGVVPDGRAVHLAALAHYCACQGDTWSSEIGVLAKSKPRLILGLRKVPAGTNGGVTLMGLAGATAGGVFMAAVMSVVQVGRGADAYPADVSMASIVVVSLASSLFGSLFDSVLGQLFQLSAFNVNGTVATSEDVRKAVGKVTVESGMDILSNNAVNFTTALVTTALFYVLAVHGVV